MRKKHAGRKGSQEGRALKRVRLTRSIFIDGEHFEKGSVRYLARPLADDLIVLGSAVRLNYFSLLFSRILAFCRRPNSKEARN